MDRVKYNNCMASGLKGKTLTKDQRQSEFCILAKVCSGKAKDRDEATRLCSQPKDDSKKMSKNSSNMIQVKAGRKTVKVSPEEFLKVCPCAQGKLQKK